MSAGANVKSVQRILGHARASMTLDTYAELFEEDLDSVSTALNNIAGPAIVGNGVLNRDSDGLLTKKTPGQGGFLAGLR